MLTRRTFQKVSLNTAIGAALIPSFFWEENPRRIPKTDTHMHLFGLDVLSYSWLNNAPEINKTFLPEDFIEATKKANVGKIVFMESGADKGSSLREVEWVRTQAHKDPRIKGIVAKAHITNDGGIDPATDKLLETDWVKGIRISTNSTILNAASFADSMKLAGQNNLSVDLLVQPRLFGDLARAIDKAPDTIFVLDHLGNPDIKGGDYQYWKKGIDELARRPNIHCKISGIITRAGKNWTVDTLKPYVHYALEQFGFNRVVYGGDWPVVLRAGTYQSWASAFEKLTRKFSKDELHRLYHLNADRIYRLDE